MILLSDNDLVIKLAQCDLLQDTLGSLNSGDKDCFVLSSLPYSLRLKDPDKSIEKYVGSSQAYERICGFLERCSVLNDAKVDFDLIDHMQQIDEVDPGEFALFLHASDRHGWGEEFKILTGDKRALSAICSYEHFDTVFSFLPGNVDCLESSMLRLINCAGYEYVNERVSVARKQVSEKKYDKVLRSAFGEGRDVQHCTECLNSYMVDVIKLFTPKMD